MFKIGHSEHVKATQHCDVYVIVYPKDIKTEIDVIFHLSTSAREMLNNLNVSNTMYLNKRVVLSDLNLREVCELLRRWISYMHSICSHFCIGKQSLYSSMGIQ